MKACIVLLRSFQKDTNYLFTTYEKLSNNGIGPMSKVT